MSRDDPQADILPRLVALGLLLDLQRLDDVRLDRIVDRRVLLAQVQQLVAPKRALGAQPLLPLLSEGSARCTL